jgi:hypothetical protein
MVSVISFKEVFKDKTQVLEAERNKQQLLKEVVNRGMQEPLDRKVFQKTPEEKGKLFTLKAQWKRDMQICYPNAKERKYRNNPVFF